MKNLISAASNTVKAIGLKTVNTATRRVMGVVNHPYKSLKTRALAILALDTGLFIAFCAVISIPAVILGASLGKTLVACIIAWLAMDAIACGVRKLSLGR